MPVDNQIIPITGGASVLNVMAGVRYSLYLGRVDLWGAAHLGYGGLTVELINKNDSAARTDDDSSGFAFSFGAGANYMVLRYLGLGLYVRVTQSMVDKVFEADFSSMGLSLGLTLVVRIGAGPDAGHRRW